MPAYDTPLGIHGCEPWLPTGLTRHFDSSEIVGQLAAWKKSSREGSRALGDVYLRRHDDRLRMSDESIWVVYFVRQTPRSGNPRNRWFLLHDRAN